MSIEVHLQKHKSRQKSQAVHSCCLRHFKDIADSWESSYNPHKLEARLNSQALEFPQELQLTQVYRSNIKLSLITKKSSQTHGNRLRCLRVISDTLETA